MSDYWMPEKPDRDIEDTREEENYSYPPQPEDDDWEYDSAKDEAFQYDRGEIQ
jgi:hypothetical protein